MNSEQTKPNALPEGYMLVERSIWTEQQVEAATACITRLKSVPGMCDRDLAMAAIDAAQCKAPEVTLADLLPAQQGQGEPVARVEVGADRNACAMIIDQDWLRQLKDKAKHLVVHLYTRADPAEVEQLRADYEHAFNSGEIARSECDALRAELSQCEAMAMMVVEREWAEHVGRGPVSGKVEEAFTQLHNDLHEAQEKLAEAHALRSFANDMISAAYEGGSFDGGDIQDMAVKHGLLRVESRAEECGEACACREYGFPAECYRKTPMLSASAEPSAPVEREAVQVEAYLVRDKEVPEHRGVRLFVDLSCCNAYTETLPLMTVAQHERIVAALERR